MNYINIKHNKIYTVLYHNVINATNKDDGKLMVLYTDNEGGLYTREKEEFNIKFRKESC